MLRCLHFSHSVQVLRCARQNARKARASENTEWHHFSSKHQFDYHPIVRTRTYDYGLDTKASSMVSGWHCSTSTLWAHVQCQNMQRHERAISLPTWQQRFHTGLCLTTFSSMFSFTCIHLLPDKLMALNWHCYYVHIKFNLAPNDI